MRFTARAIRGGVRVAGNYHWYSCHCGKDPRPIQAPPLTPPQHVPFSVGRGDDGILITVHADAGQHPGLSQRQASLWIKGATFPVAVDLGRITLLNSRIVGWLFSLIVDGPMTVLDIRNANRHIHAQIKRIGLAAFIASPPAPAQEATPAAGQPIGLPSGSMTAHELTVAMVQPATG